MGEEKVNVPTQDSRSAFTHHLLQDVQALEYMLKHKWFETDTIRIGAEQEMCLVDKKTLKPTPKNMNVLKRLKQYPWATTEIARFNLETNFTPQVFKGDALRRMEEENMEQLRIVKEAAKASNAQIVLTGILPTLRKFDLNLENLTPKPRYLALIEAIKEQQKNERGFTLNLQGIDDLHIHHDSPLLEACNTSYQVHLQVTPDTFVPLYNIAQAVAAPILAIAANSPLVFGKRLWHESRIALFQQSLDVRTSKEHMRQSEPRVSFGTQWLDKSLMEIYKEDIARFRVLLGTEIDEDSLEMIGKQEIPKLRALQVHNGTVYRWNRPCYGISDNGKPHLRIENRVLPAGPTVLDQTANAAFWLGLMMGMAHKYKDIREHMSFADAKDNFSKAAKFGIDTQFTWFNNQKINCRDLILQELIPIAYDGLVAQGIDKPDIERYLGVIQGRAEVHQNGARWLLKSFTQLTERVNRDEAVTILTSQMVKCQLEQDPVHKWPIPKVEDLKHYRPVGLRVEEFMETDLFTVRETDLLELVGDLMDWRKLRYLPVEDEDGHLCGLITTRKLLRYYIHKGRVENEANDYKTVADLMIKNPATVGPQTTIKEAMQTMRGNKLGCLPVVKEGELVGIITEMDFLRVAGRLIERLK
ncbi:CBS domain-containing protein/gamma-glutamyl:cysteine ligase YbdK (ATP-grasp superfamily) [Lewinella aquimaris]|uniref:CBS domain-containing protein/gamma-glutamyl:cysteine ligase YbdK (ATP-grasp superfamily) n=1 Tax=Neolewinella aquimaris TaxID=1835722 RepID=A0A840E1F5_9BACT|nr:CBS domain-containing protein [Neolewinella aquimaris]MBB4078950.1 CBS domain-containing protein/gamma-glutamyl:cysteine ligase YbdK (ATP-grasp superfamily) [Neolewinella aquimaris]